MSRTLPFINFTIVAVACLFALSSCKEKHTSTTDLLKDHPGIDAFPAALAKKNKILEPDFNMPVPEAVARGGAAAFRYDHSSFYKFGKYFVTYDTTAIINYIRSTFITQITGHSVPINHKWEVGFYPVTKIDPDSSKAYIDFVVIPTLVPTNGSKSIYEYFDNPGGKYDKTRIIPYDFGNLHP
jgi:hypothetical protein